MNKLCTYYSEQIYQISGKLMRARKNNDLDAFVKALDELHEIGYQMDRQIETQKEILSWRKK